MENNENNISNEAIQKKRLLHKIILAIIFLMAGWIFAMIFMKPSTYKYYLKNPKNIDQRTAMIKDLEQTITELKTTNAQDSTKSAADDPDRYYPLTRSMIILAIEKYILENEVFPQREDLLNKGYLKIGDLKTEITTHFIIKVYKDKWLLFVGPNQIAEGN